MKLLLDTCTFLWIVEGHSNLSEEASVLFSEPSNQVFLSSVSAWEIGVKHKLGRLNLSLPPREFVPKFRSAHQVLPLPLEEEAALQVGCLPDFHRDPFDRMLVCQAIFHGLVILTPDAAIQQYPVRFRW